MHHVPHWQVHHRKCVRRVCVCAWCVFISAIVISLLNPILTGQDTFSGIFGQFSPSLGISLCYGDRTLFYKSFPMSHAWDKIQKQSISGLFMQPGYDSTVQNVLISNRPEGSLAKIKTLERQVT